MKAVLIMSDAALIVWDPNLWLLPFRLFRANIANAKPSPVPVRVKALTWGIKGVGAQGDGSVQMLARGSQEQEDLTLVLKEMGEWRKQKGQGKKPSWRGTMICSNKRDNNDDGHGDGHGGVDDDYGELGGTPPPASLPSASSTSRTLQAPAAV